MRVPVQMMIGGKKIRIDYPDVIPGDTPEEGDLSGDSQVLGGRIRISKTQNKSPEAVLHTIFHEALHMAIGITGHSEILVAKQEEALVYAIESMLAPLLILNPAAPVKYREIEFPWENE